MPSPFPGMNPYMEARAGVHLHLLANFGQQLASQIRPRYRIHTERDLQLDAEPGKFRPDLRLQRFDPTAQMERKVAATTTPSLITENLPYSDTDIPPHLEIITPDGEVVTIIEVLSPINKEGEYQSYLTKRYRLLKAGISLVEIDLLRDGERIPLATSVNAPYLAAVSRAWEYPQAHIWHISWQTPCPILPIPLRPDEAEASLDLKTALDQAYEVEFEGFIDYRQPPPGTLPPVWQQEINALLETQGLR